MGWLARVVIAAGLTLAACSSAAPQPPKPCGPFGDPPADTVDAPLPYCLSGVRLGPWHDPDGNPRYACLYEPQTEGGAGPLPLVVYLHPSLFGTETIYLTGLLHYKDSFALGNSGKRGYIVLEPMGRRTDHRYPFPDQKGLGWDNWYRQLNPEGAVTAGGTSYRENVDAAAIDHFIGEIAQTRRVDRERVYLTGWSNGAAMAYLYALNRPAVAAAAVYSGPDPFGAFDDSCPQTPVTGPPTEPNEVRIYNPHLPSLHIHNDCDVAGLCLNSQRLTSQLRAGGLLVSDVVVNALGQQVSGCMAACGADPMGDANVLSNPLGWTLGLLNHGRWPLTWTRTMLEFLRGHPLSR